MLSDACSDFLTRLDRAAVALAEAASWYGSDDFAIYRDQTDALLRACTRVRETSYDDEVRFELLRLTAAVMRSYDAPIGSSSWC